ncbi:hypothetical protein ACFL6I_03610 [candidate division KSB1 bacterium]
MKPHFVLTAPYMTKGMAYIAGTEYPYIHSVSLISDDTVNKNTHTMMFSEEALSEAIRRGAFRYNAKLRKNSPKKDTLL